MSLDHALRRLWAALRGLPRGSTMTGFFPSNTGAQQAKRQLIAVGIDVSSIAISAHITEDGVAAEAPGQDYGNELYYAASRSYEDEVQSSAVVLTVSGRPADARGVERILRANGARRTMLRR